MKKLFRKAATVVGSVALVGASMSGAVASTFPAPFDSGDYAVVYGSGSEDASAASTVAAALPAMGDDSDDTTPSADFSFDETITDDEVELRTAITAGDRADIEATLDDGDLVGLADSKFSWDDGTGSSDYDYNEVIEIGTLTPITSMDDAELEDNVALTNENGLTYKYVIEDGLNISEVGADDADTLYLDIMGHEYEVESMTADSISVVTSEEVSLSIDGSYTTDDGTTVTVVDIFDGSVEVSVDGETEVISSGTSARVSGIRIKVDTVGYHSNAPESSRTVMKIGEDISKTYSSGEEFVGENEDDPLWIWEISGLDADDGYIGVKYNADIDDIDDLIAGDSIKYVGEGYIFPNNYAGVTLDGLSDVSYTDLRFSFEEEVDLFEADDTSAANDDLEDEPVFVVESLDDQEGLTALGSTGDADNPETKKIYLHYNATDEAVQMYYDDTNEGEYVPSGRMRLVNDSVLDVSGLAAVDSATFATFINGDTELDLVVRVDGGNENATTVLVKNNQNSDNTVLNLSIGGDTIATDAGTFEHLGSTADDAEAEDVTFDGTDVSTKDYSYMNEYGVKLSSGTTVDKEADDDQATLSIPDDRLYAEVTVGLGASVSSDSGSTGTTGQKTFTDSETSSFAGRDIVVVGGSCINSVAADLLGGSYCGEDYTSETTVGPGKFQIETFDRDGNTATLVAGYNKDDTAKAATYLANEGNAVMTDVGVKYIGETATENAVKVS